jgi:hypothetical protein
MNLNENFSIPIHFGNVLVFQYDDGPTGICGQSMSITCPHMVIHWFETEDKCIESRDKNGLVSRRGQNSRIHVIRVGEGGTCNTSIILH